MLSSLLTRVPRTLLAAGLLAVAAQMIGCSGSANTEGRTITGQTTVDSGVTISSSTSSTAILPNGTLTLSASVPTDTTNSGVTWQLIGVGTLSSPTATTVVYTAPSSVTGTATPIVIATSVHDSTDTGSVTLAVQGTPVLEAADLYPAYVSTAYTTRVVVAGGQADYTWTLDSGTLPAGITLGTSVSSQVALSGTPTVAGTYNFTLKVVDNQSRSATVALTLVVNPAVTCLISGQFAVLYSGFHNSVATARAASLTLTSAGVLTGLQDHGGGAITNDPLTGKCAITSTNAGTFLVTGTGGNTTYSHVVSSTPDHGRLALTAPTTDQGSGSFYQQDATAFTQAALAGDFAFGLIGADTSGTHMGVAGRLTVDSAGAVTNATVERNGATPLTDAAAAGTMTAPDGNGRGTLTLTTTVSNETMVFAYYVVNANKLLLVDITGASNARVSGFMTRQSGTFDSTAVASPGVMSLWGSSGSSESVAAAALGRISAAIDDGGGSSGTLSLALDSAEQGTVHAAQNYSGVAYAVDTTGRVTLSYTNDSVTRSFVLYLDSAANGYVVETDNANDDNNAGLLEAQTGSAFSNTLAGLFISGTQWPVSPGPISTLPSVVITNGIMSSTYGTGYFYVDADTGRGAGSFVATIIGTDAIVVYELDSTRVRVLRLGTPNRDASIDWLDR